MLGLNLNQINEGSLQKLSFNGYLHRNRAQMYRTLQLIPRQLEPIASVFGKTNMFRRLRLAMLNVVAWLH